MYARASDLDPNNEVDCRARIVDETNRCHDPFHFPVVFPNGDAGWAINLHARPKQVSPPEFQHWDPEAGKWCNADRDYAPPRLQPTIDRTVAPKNAKKLNASAYYAFRVFPRSDEAHPEAIFGMGRLWQGEQDL